jgi:hypothetical protein
MLAAGRVDYAQVNLAVGMGYIAALGHQVRFSLY